jgi:hypothetical protein
LLPDLSIQLVGVLTSGGPSFTEIGLIGQDARTWATRGSLRETLRSDEASDCVASDAKLPGDRSDPHSSFMQPHDLLISGLSTTPPLLFLALCSGQRSASLVLFGLTVQVSRRWSGLRESGRDVGQAGVVAHEQALDGLAQIAEHMEAISNLNAIRCSVTRSLGIGAAPVPTNNLHPGMLRQPLSEGFRRPIRQQINPTVPLQIDQHGPVLPPATNGKVIDAQHARRLMLGEGSVPDDTEERVWARSHRERRKDSGASLTTEGKANQLEDGHQPVGAPGIGCSERRESLGEDPARTVLSLPKEPANGEMQPDRDAIPGQISECSDVVAMHPLGMLAAERAGRTVLLAGDN